jgi:hypothetical protein
MTRRNARFRYDLAKLVHASAWPARAGHLMAAALRGVRPSL